MKVLKIISAKHIKEYTLEVLFDDGKSVTVDFGEFLRKSKNPQIGKYLKIENFKKAFTYRRILSVHGRNGFGSGASGFGGLYGTTGRSASGGDGAQCCGHGSGDRQGAVFA